MRLRHSATLLISNIFFNLPIQVLWTEMLARLGLVERLSGETENGYQLSKTAHKIAAELGEFEKPYSGTILSQGDSRISVDELLKQIDEDF